MGTGNISNGLNASVPFKSIADPHQTGGGDIPRAYLNVMFFNERFEFVEEGSTALRVSQPGDNASPLVLAGIKAPKNGYAYIYLSNPPVVGQVENDDAVYFDNFTVSYTRGRIIEENHYYAFGLRIDGISSRKYDGGLEGSLKNDYLYNDKELWQDADLDWYDYGFRNYDPQIARFTQLDPLTWDYPELTNYQYASNEPIANVDLDGLEGASAIIEEFIKQGGKPLQEIVVVGKSAAQVASTASTTTRIFGGLKAIGGVLEAGVGVAVGIGASWTGIGAVGGAFVAAHGADLAASGFSQMLTGREAKSFTQQGISKGLQAAGVSDSRADYWAGNVDAGISIFGSGWAGGAIVNGIPAASRTVAAGSSAAKTGLSFNKGVLKNFTKHAFTGGRHADLGLSVETMASKGLNLIEQNMPLLKAGDNTLIGNINRIQKSFKAFVKDGKVMSVNMYPGVTNRATQGTVINFGNVTW